MFEVIGDLYSQPTGLGLGQAAVFAVGDELHLDLRFLHEVARLDAQRISQTHEHFRA